MSVGVGVGLGDVVVFDGFGVGLVDDGFGVGDGVGDPELVG